MGEIINKIGELKSLRNRIENYSTFEETLLNKDELLKAKNELVEYLKNTPNAMGISAPQLGISLPIFAIKMSDGIKNFINPVVQDWKQPRYNREGCMSFPDIQAYVIRFYRIETEFLQFNHKDELKKQKKNFIDQESAAFQHEMDHLLGFTIMDRAVPLTEDQSKELNKYKIQRVFRDESIKDYFFEEGENANKYFYSGEDVPEFRKEIIDGIETDAPLKKSFVGFKVLEISEPEDSGLESAIKEMNIKEGV